MIKAIFVFMFCSWFCVVAAQDSRDPVSKTKTKEEIKAKGPYFKVPKGYTYPQGRFPQAKFSGVKTPKNDFAKKPLTLKNFNKMLAQKRKEFRKRIKRNKKIDKKVARKMEKEWYFLMNYGFVPKKKEIRKNNL